MGKDTRERRTTSMELPVAVANVIRGIADHRGLNIPEVFEKYALPALRREHAKCVEEMNRELGEAGA